MRVEYYQARVVASYFPETRVEWAIWPYPAGTLLPRNIAFHDKQRKIYVLFLHIFVKYKDTMCDGFRRTYVYLFYHVFHILIKQMSVTGQNYVGSKFEVIAWSL